MTGVISAPSVDYRGFVLLNCFNITQGTDVTERVADKLYAQSVHVRGQLQLNHVPGGTNTMQTNGYQCPATMPDQAFSFYTGQGGWANMRNAAIVNANNTYGNTQVNANGWRRPGAQVRIMAVQYEQSGDVPTTLQHPGVHALTYDSGDVARPPLAVISPYKTIDVDRKYKVLVDKKYTLTWTKPQASVDFKFKVPKSTQIMSYSTSNLANDAPQTNPIQLFIYSDTDYNDAHQDDTVRFHAVHRQRWLE